MLQHFFSCKILLTKVITIVKLTQILQNAHTLFRNKITILTILLIRPYFTIVVDKYCHNTSQDKKILAKSYDNINNEPIIDAKLSKLNFHILALGYLKEGVSHFTKLATKIQDKND